jgi:hypothetical protein
VHRIIASNGPDYDVEYTPPPSPPLPPEFKYERLPHKRQSIRLLNLFSGSPENAQIECEFIVVDIDPKKLTKNTKDYEVLSWCWGMAQPSSHLTVRNQGRLYSKKVQLGLVTALKALRHPQEDRCLWIDAICINQADVWERNHQVEMMSAIYSQAKSV